VYSYEHEDGTGPDSENLAFDLANGSKTPWNTRIFDILLNALQKRSVEEGWPLRRSDAYYREMLEDRYRRLRTTWRAAQPKVTAKGALETAEEVEERLIAKRNETLRSIRQTTRRRNVCVSSQSYSDTNAFTEIYPKNKSSSPHRRAEER
jgi:hypothetical protein